MIINSQRASGDATSRFTSRRRDIARHNPHIDAAWWPRSADLGVELVELLQAAQEAGFHATGVTYRLDDAWIAPPRRIVFGARRVKVSGYHNHHRDMITLVDGGSHERWEVMVVPSDTTPLVAERALRIAANRAEPTHGADVLALARGNARATDADGQTAPTR